jgi:beta-galactosidase
MGNEIPETGSAAGAAQSRAMLEKFHQLDQSRPIANCINGMFSVMPQMRTILAEVLDSQVGELPTDINELMSMFDANIGEIMKHPIVANATEETFAGVDVCGYNYMASRYEPDGTLYPNRVIVGSETNPDQIGYNWPVVSKLPYVIGDFCWTAWEYIGEAGVGKNDYDMTHAMYGPWPWFLAYCGDFDLCGNRRPQSFYREIVFGQRKQPYVCAERPEHYGQEKCVTNWTWPDVVESWTWPGFEGKHTHVEVYSDAQEVELILNGTSLGSQTVGETMPYKAIFDVEYQPGTLVAVAKNQGQEVSRMELTTCGKETGVSLTPEKDTIPADGMALTYINVELVDDTGALVPAAQADVTIQVEGPGVVAGFGSANPATEELFNSDTHSTFDGRALVILRATEKAGTVTITATAPGLKEGRAVVHIQ